MVTVTILYDNEVYQEGLKSDWGFSCLIEKENSPKILFDTGANGSVLLSNMEKLEIEPISIDEIFISHNHFDHIGGLSSFLNVNNKVKVYVPVSLRGVRAAKEIIYVDKSLNIHKNFFSTGELGGIEQSLVIKGENGLVVIAGCSHPGVGNILKAASQLGSSTSHIHALVGGLHGFSEFNLIKDLDLICPVHCTQFKEKIKELYPEKYIPGGVGKIIQI